MDKASYQSAHLDIQGVPFYGVLGQVELVPGSAGGQALCLCSWRIFWCLDLKRLTVCQGLQGRAWHLGLGDWPSAGTVWESVFTEVSLQPRVMWAGLVLGQDRSLGCGTHLKPGPSEGHLELQRWPGAGAKQGVAFIEAQLGPGSIWTYLAWNQAGNLSLWVLLRAWGYRCYLGVGAGWDHGVCGSWLMLGCTSSKFIGTCREPCVMLAAHRLWKLVSARAGWEPSTMGAI